MTEIHTYYNQGREQGRLGRDEGRLELIRTKEIIQRYLPPAPQTVLDVGGGAGVYALWLAGLGYVVDLVDLVPLHIEQAREASAQQADFPLHSATVGNALSLDFDDASMDAVLLLGPLYHLQERDDRMQALKEAYRVLKPGGWVFAAGISRFASLMDGFRRGTVTDDVFAGTIERVLVNSKHENLVPGVTHFTTAYFHYPADLREEMRESGLAVEALMTVEGMGTYIRDLDLFLNDDHLRERMLGFIRATESEPALMGATGHLMAVGRKIAE